VPVKGGQLKSVCGQLGFKLGTVAEITTSTIPCTQNPHRFRPRNLATAPASFKRKTKGSNKLNKTQMMA
jgi:hypothetical protein